ncbi:hypothetical protein PYCC9005_002461 [Savitreella phatthalungensis]
MVAYKATDYAAWYRKVQEDIVSLPKSATHTRAQQFVQQFPNALIQFSDKLEQSTFSRALEDFQRHPNFILRFLLAEWRDEATKKNRVDLDDIMRHSLERVKASQAWRSGQGEFWKRWSFKDIDDLYNNYKTSPEAEIELQSWFPQQFYGCDRDGYPVHYEMLPSGHRPELLRDMTLRRIVNNEHTLRFREPRLNPPPVIARSEAHRTPQSEDADAVAASDIECSNPRIGVTWVIDCRRLSIWQSSSIYKTAQAMIEASQQVTSQNYPEQGHQALVVNLGQFWGSMYNLAMKVMPAQTQRTTLCFASNQVLHDRIGWEQVPVSYKDIGAKKVSLTPEERSNAAEDVVPSASGTA